MADSRQTTIAAIATPPGAGGIGIIRLSGPQALSILHKIFVPRQPLDRYQSHFLYYGHIVDPLDDTMVDEVLAVYMRGPKSYTREDVVEIQCHSSFLILQKILGIVQHAGARLADPGEFTKLAFLNGRLDLTQAEAVLELLQAQTDKGLTLAMNQLKGGLHEEIESLRDILVSMRAILEVAIDFPDEDVEIVPTSDFLYKIRQEVTPAIGQLIAAHDQGKIYRDGLSAVIIGRPNVGKSSLLNALLKEERALVTPIPGTTRDTIEEFINIQGIPLHIIDTAGIRQFAESVEELGIQRARKIIQSADLVLLVLDSSEMLQPEDFHLFETIAEKQTILVANKQDIAQSDSLDKIAASFPKYPLVNLSAKNCDGLDRLEETIFATITGSRKGYDPGHGVVPNLRQKMALVQAQTGLQRLVELLESEALHPDLLAIELQSVLDCLGDIVGHTTPEDILDTIFDAFCIGK